MAGSDKLFIHLEPHVMKDLDKYSDRDFSHVAYAYSIRTTGNPELYKAFDQRLEQMAENGEILDYPTMHNLIYYMMFRDNTSKKVWAHIIESTLQQDDILPIVYYKPFKYSRFFLQAHFPEWDISDFVDRFWYAEQYFNQVQLDDYLTSDFKYFEMKCFLNQKCLVYPIVFMTEHNLFNLHYVFYDQKIAINYHLEKMCRPFVKQPSELQKLPAKLLKHEGWEVLDLSEHDFKNWKHDEKIANVKGWLKEAKERQIAKGITKEYEKPIWLIDK